MNCRQERKDYEDKWAGIPVQSVMIIFLCLRFYLLFSSNITMRRAGVGGMKCVCVCVWFFSHTDGHTHTHTNSFHWLLILETHLTQADENLQLLTFNIINIPNVIKSIVKMYIQWFYEAQDLQMDFRGSSRVLCSVHCWTTVENPGAHAWLLEPSRGF